MFIAFLVLLFPLFGLRTPPLDDSSTQLDKTVEKLQARGEHHLQVTRNTFLIVPIYWLLLHSSTYLLPIVVYICTMIIIWTLHLPVNTGISFKM